MGELRNKKGTVVGRL